MANYPGTISSLRHLQRSRLDPEQSTQKMQYQEVIQYFGIDTIYFRHSTEFYDGVVSASNIDYTYGEKPTTSYDTSAPLIVLAEMFADNNLLNKFGIETNSNGSCYILMDDFTEVFRDSLGIQVSSFFETTMINPVSAFNGVISGTFGNSELSAFVLSSINLPTSGIYTDVITFNNVYRVPKKLHPYIARSPVYSTRVINGSMDGVYTSNLDISGTGFITSYVSGYLNYFDANLVTKYGPNWKIAPQVGDFFRIDFDELNHEEYEITRLYDRSLQTDGINPLLFRYVWKMDIVRRDPSYENILSGSVSQEEAMTRSKSEQNITHDIMSNFIFDYSSQIIDNKADNKQGLDKVYGGY
jgi:hypothetical protein